MYNSEMWFSASRYSDKELLIKFLIGESSGSCRKLHLISERNKEKIGVRLETITDSQIRKIVRENDMIGIHSATSISILGYIEEYFGKEFVSSDQYGTVLNISDNWKIYGNIMHDDIAHLINKVYGLSGGDISLNIDDDGEVYFYVTCTNIDQMNEFVNGDFDMTMTPSLQIVNVV